MSSFFEVLSFSYCSTVLLKAVVKSPADGPVDFFIVDSLECYIESIYPWNLKPRKAYAKVIK